MAVPAEPIVIRPAAGKLLLGVRVSPSARITALQGVYGDRIKVSVSAPPEDNRANQELTQAFSRWIGVGRDEVCVQAGHGGRDKVLAVAGLDEAELRSRLSDLLQAGGPLERKPKSR